MSRWRLALWAGLILGWLVMLLYLWTGFATFPSQERLEHSRMTAIPTLRTLATLGVRSALELGVVLALAWPWWRRFYALRLLAAALLLSFWFIATTPLTLSTVDWVHRRWIAATTGALLLASLAAFVAHALRFATRGGPPPASPSSPP